MPLLLLCLLSVCGLMRCAEKKTAEKATEQTSSPIAEILSEAVVIDEQLLEDTLKGSLKAYEKNRIGSAEIKITYHSPAVRGRIVWGGLVPFDRVWVTGAHMATTLEVSSDFMFNERLVLAGKYGLFTIPAKDKWIVIINKNWQQHLTDEYDSKEDVARIEVTPVSLSTHQERLRYEIITKTTTEGLITITWEKLQLQVPIIITELNFD